MATVVQFETQTITRIKLGKPDPVQKIDYKFIKDLDKPDAGEYQRYLDLIAVQYHSKREVALYKSYYWLKNRLEWKKAKVIKIVDM